jgi:hypothetical protein
MKNMRNNRRAVTGGVSGVAIAAMITAAALNNAGAVNDSPIAPEVSASNETAGVTTRVETPSTEAAEIETANEQEQRISGTSTDEAGDSQVGADNSGNGGSSNGGENNSNGGETQLPSNPSVLTPELDPQYPENPGTATPELDPEYPENPGTVTPEVTVVQMHAFVGMDAVPTVAGDFELRHVHGWQFIKD